MPNDRSTSTDARREGAAVIEFKEALDAVAHVEQQALSVLASRTATDDMLSVARAAQFARDRLIKQLEASQPE